MYLANSQGRTNFNQWDTGQTLTLTGLETCHEVHFCHYGDEKALVCQVREDSGRRCVDVPNIFLQSPEEFLAYLFCRDGEGTRTQYCERLTVTGRPKPEDYIYTETEVLSYSTLDQRLKELEGEGLANALAGYLEKNPVEAGATAEEAAQIAKNRENIEKLTTDKLDATKLPEAVNEALTQAKASGVFDGEDGKTPVKGEDYFTKADKQEIAEQAAKLVDVPCGGKEKLEIIFSHTITEEEAAASVITFTASQYPNIKSQKNLAVQIHPGVYEHTALTLKVGSKTVLSWTAGSGWAMLGFASVFAGKWLCGTAKSSNLFVATTFNPFSISYRNQSNDYTKFAIENAEFQEYDSITIDCGVNTLAPGMLIVIYGS